MFHIILRDGCDSLCQTYMLANSAKECKERILSEYYPEDKKKFRNIVRIFESNISLYIQNNVSEYHQDMVLIFGTIWPLQMNCYEAIIQINGHKGDSIHKIAIAAWDWNAANDALNECLKHFVHRETHKTILEKKEITVKALLSCDDYEALQNNEFSIRSLTLKEADAKANLKCVSDILFFEDELTLEYGMLADYAEVKKIVLEKNLDTDSDCASPFASCSMLESFEIEKSDGDFYVVDGVLYMHLNDMSRHRELVNRSWQANSSTLEGDVLIAYPRGKHEKTFSVPEGVVAIGCSAFEGADIKELILPESIEVIDSYSLDELNGIEKIKVPNKYLSLMDSGLPTGTQIESKQLDLPLDKNVYEMWYGRFFCDFYALGDIATVQ